MEGINIQTCYFERSVAFGCMVSGLAVRTCALYVGHWIIFDLILLILIVLSCSAKVLTFCSG